MAVRRKNDNQGKLFLLGVTLLLFVFALVSLLGFRNINKEIRSVTAGQQELILALTMKDQKNYSELEEGEEHSTEKFVSEMEFKRYIIENERTINQLKQDVQRLQYQVKKLKRPL